MPITTTTTTPTTTTTTISHSVIELYTSILGRPADGGGLKFWADAFASLANAAPVTTPDQNTYALKTLATSFVSSSEYKQKLPANDHASEVKHTFKNIFNTDADAATVQTYVSKLDAGTATVADVALEILNSAKASPTAKAHLDNKTAFGEYVSGLATSKHIDVSQEFNKITHDPKTLDDAKKVADTVLKDTVPPVFDTAPVDPTVPVSPTAPTAPTAPVDPTAPVSPTAPVDPTAPTAPVDPTAPVSPTAPTAPTAPVDPTAPVSPTAPTAPTAPVDPTAPVSPTASTAPTAPVDPTAPTPVNALTGTSGVDTLTGTANADSIIGAGSADKLTGGASADTFIYKAISITDLMNEVGSVLAANATTLPSLTTVEEITDFVSGTDKIQLSAALVNSLNGATSTTYSATTTTGLTAANFAVIDPVKGLAATTTAHFYFNPANNVLYFDAKGDTAVTVTAATGTATAPTLTVAGAADDFAVLQLTGAITAADFVFA